MWVSKKHVFIVVHNEGRMTDPSDRSRIFACGERGTSVFHAWHVKWKASFSRVRAPRGPPPKDGCKALPLRMPRVKPCTRLSVRRIERGRVSCQGSERTISGNCAGSDNKTDRQKGKTGKVHNNEKLTMKNVKLKMRGEKKYKTQVSFSCPPFMILHFSFFIIG